MEALMLLKKISDFLDANHVRYVVITHSPAYTAQGIAALAHIPGKQMAKTVIVRANGKFMMAVLPASQHVDLRALRTVLGSPDVHIAHESDFEALFPGCELGAMPPFGNLYGMPIYCDTSLRDDRQIAFNAGSHRELIQMDFDDYLQLVKPRIATFGALPTPAGSWHGR
jgi:Ala-tRNA(Pro) deacylase